MKAVVRKWGNSLGLRLPASLAAEINVSEGTELQIFVQNNRLIAMPKKPSLRELVDKMDPNTLPDKIEWGGPVGNEIW